MFRCRKVAEPPRHSAHCAPATIRMGTLCAPVHCRAPSARNPPFQKGSRCPTRRNHLQTSAPRRHRRRRTGRRLCCGHPDQVQRRQGRRLRGQHRPVRGLPRALRPDPLRRGPGPPAHQGHRQRAAQGPGPRRHPLPGQRHLRPGPDPARLPRLLRRRHLLHRRHQGRGPGHPRHRARRAPSAARTSSPGTTATRTSRATGRWTPRKSP